MTMKRTSANRVGRPSGVGVNAPSKTTSIPDQPATPSPANPISAATKSAHPAQATARSVGETLAADLADPHRKRGTYALLNRAINIALDIPYEAMTLACDTAVRDLTSPDDRIRSRAREFLFKVQDSGIGAVIGLDKINRLDDGMSTENVVIAAITPEAIAAVVSTLRHSTEGLGRQ